MSQQQVMQVGQMAAGAVFGDMGAGTQRAVMGAFGMGAQVGVLLPFSRTQESEADIIGEMLMANAGYPPGESIAIWDRMEAGTPFESPVDLGPEGKSKKGTLEIADAERSYKFENINLRFCEQGVTRRERYRLLEFRYDKEVLDTKTVTLMNSSEAKLKKSGLDEDYTFSLGGGTQQVLGFRAQVAADHATLVRFSALRCKENSFLEKVVELNAEQQKDNTKMPSFTITFSQGDIEVNRENLQRIYVDESYGELRRLSLPRLSDLIAAQPSPELSRLHLNDFTGQELLDHDTSQRFVDTQLDPKTVETATLVFEPGYKRDIKVK
jgi:hypothetical protein